ncbi:MAG: Na+/H+ antiporter NhaC family protein [Bacteroidota bacterium]
MKRRALLLVFFCACYLSGWGQSAVPDRTSAGMEMPHQVRLEYPRLVRVGEEVQVQVEVQGWEESKIWVELVGQSGQSVALEQGKGEIFLTVPNQVSPSMLVGGKAASLNWETAPFPLWLSLLPPLIAILLALITREVIVSLFVGIFVGAATLGWYVKGGLFGIGSGFLAVLDTYVLHALTDADHVAILVFSLMIGGMVAIISRNGGMQAIVQVISRYAKSPRSGQFATWLLGLVIFFDDYANTLVVGNTMRPVTDKLRISREKLAYLVDSTAAPVAALAFITTWIGAELGYIEDGIAGLSNFPTGQSPYRIFLGSLGYSFYPILTLLFMLILIYSGRDFGPMKQAETKAREGGTQATEEANAQLQEEVSHFQPKANIPIRLVNSLVPIGVLIAGVLIGLIYTGHDPAVWQEENLNFFQKLSTTIGNADSYAALLWASLTAVAAAVILSVGQKLMSLQESMENLGNGFKAMMGALIILTLAWALQGVTNDLHTADYLIDLLGQNLQPYALPTITFLLAALVAFSTGSSWGTMAILYPLIIPLSWEIGLNHGMETEAALSILYNVVASVLAGAVLGDHCSPISDTTILSSLATSCDHIAHVRTQLPYALTVGGIAVLLGTLPSAFGIPTWLCFGVSLLALYGIIRFFGKIGE